MKDELTKQTAKRQGQTEVYSALRNGITLCLCMSMIIVSGCAFTNNKATMSPTLGINNTTPTPTPTITNTLKNQGSAALETLQQWINLIQHYRGDATEVSRQYAADKNALLNARTANSYKDTLTTINQQIAAIKLPAMKTEATHLQNELRQEVSSWGQTHIFHNAYDHTDYPLGYEYSDKGIGSWVQADLSIDQSVADYQQTIENLNMYLTNFQALMTNAKDKSAYNQMHTTDMQLIQQNNRMDQKVVVVSLLEQAMRVYDHGKLVNSFLVTTGRPDRPSIPGNWWVENKIAPTTFKAGVPQSDPNWYPDTPINYAMLYHSNGYYIHDSWWRNDYGPGTNYPHADSSGDSFSSQGSHGCVNLSKDNAAWLYSFVEAGTGVIIY